MPEPTDPNQQQQQPPAVTPDQQTPATPAQQPTPQTPAQQPTPNQPQAQPTPQGQPQNPTPAATPAPQDKPHPISRIFDGILKTMTGGPVTYVDANGQKQVAPQSRGSMGKAIVAAALAGLMTPTQYREGAFGSRVVDYGATAGNAAQAGKGVMDAYRNKPQQLSDEEQSRRLVALTSNSNLIKNMAASTLQSHAALQSMVDSSKPLLTSIQEYEKTRTADQPSALIGENLSKEEAEAKMQGHFTEWKAIPTGTVSVLNPETHKNEENPTYSIVNPTVKVPLNEDAVNILATVNPTYKGAWEATNGKVEVPLSVAVSTQHLVNEAHVVQAFADSPGLKSAFPDMKQANVAAALRGPNGKQLATALDATRDSIAAGQPTYKTLDAIAHAPNGRALLDALGLSPDAVNDYVQQTTNESVEAQSKAKAAGQIEKVRVAAGLKPITAANAPNLIADPNSPPELRKRAQSVLDIVNTQKARQLQQEQVLKTGTPDDAGRLLANGDLTLTELRSRGTTPKFITDAVAAANKINPQYNAQKADAEYRLAGSQQNQTFFGSANSLLDADGTLGQLKDNYAKLQNGQIPLFNKWEDYLGYESGDPAMAGFLQTAVGVADDYAKVMGGGTGSDSSRLQVMKSFANAHNPQQMQAAIDAARNAVSSQVRSRIGSNSIMAKMYGFGIPNAQSGVQSRQVPNQTPNSQQVVPAGAIAGRDAQGNIIGYKTADGKVVKF